MIRGRKVMKVGMFEFLSTVKRKGYLIATLGMPVFVLAYGGVVSFFAGYAVSKKENEVRVFGVVDTPQVLRLAGDASAPLPKLPEAAMNALKLAGGDAEKAAAQAIARGNAVFRPFESKETARAALDKQQIKGYYVITEDYLKNGRVDSFIGDGAPLDRSGAGKQLGELIVQRLLAGRVDEDVAKLVREPLSDKGKRWVVMKDGQVKPRDVGSEIAKLVVPIGFAMLLMISLLTSAGYLLQAVATEKENKVIEVLLSSADPDEILTGKLLGLGSAGLIQVAVWFSMGAVAAAVTAVAMEMAGFTIPWLAIGLGIVYFVLGYLMIGSLMIGTASLGSTMREAQQYSMVWTGLTVIPLIVLNAMLAEPAGMVAKVLTWIPFTTPLTMILRLSIDASLVHWWEIVGSIVLMLGSIVLAIKLGARLFRIGVLMSGARPSFKEIVRQAVLSPSN